MTSRRRIADAAVNAQRVIARWLGVNILDHDVDIESPARTSQHGGGRFLSFKYSALVVTQHKRHMDASTHYRQRNRFVRFSKSKYPGIVINASRTKSTRLAAIALSSGHGRVYAANGPDCQVGGKTVGFPNVGIAGVMQLDVIRYVLPHCNRKRFVAGVRKRLASIRQLFRHSGRWLHFAFYGALTHSESYITSKARNQRMGGFPPPPPKEGGLQPQYL